MKLMMTYLLLRDNKEIGPLSLEELKKMGLKPNDLIWVEGQSVCWQNPTELKELKDLAGTGKPLQDNLEDSNTASLATKPAIEQDINDYKPGYQPIGSAAHQSISAYMPVAEEETFVAPAQTLPKKSVTPAVETKYSQPLDELKELYAKTLEQRLKKKSFPLHIPPRVRKIGLYAGLLAAGIIAGILINKRDKKDRSLATVSSLPAGEKTTIPPQEPVPGDSTVIITPITTMPPIDEKVFAEERPTNEIDKPTEIRKTPNPQPVEIKPDLAEKTEEKTERPAARKETKENTLNELGSSVSVKSNDYDVGSFGGIRNLRLTVTNDSKYNLDHVVVELQYLKPRDEFLMSENISFHAIGPNDSKTILIPKSTRGVKVAFKILRIESKEMSSNTAGL